MKMNSNTQTTNKISYDNIKEMVIERDFEKHKYNLPVHGANAPSGSSIHTEDPRSSSHSAGIIDTVKSVADFVSQNKDTFKNVSKAVSSVSSASSNIAQAIKAAKRLMQLEIINEPGEFDTMLKFLTRSKDYEDANIEGWIPDTGTGNSVADLTAADEATQLRVFKLLFVDYIFTT